MGEILAPAINSFDPDTTLLWKHITVINKDNISVFLPFTKTRGLNGELIELFSFNILSCCPVSALLNLRNFATSHNVTDAGKPVFT